MRGSGARSGGWSGCGARAGAWKRVGPPSGRLLLPAFPAFLFQVLGGELHLLLREHGNALSHASLGGGTSGASPDTHTLWETPGVAH